LIPSRQAFPAGHVGRRLWRQQLRLHRWLPALDRFGAHDQHDRIPSVFYLDAGVK
jgi:hypothetical protein